MLRKTAVGFLLSLVFVLFTYSSAFADTPQFNFKGERLDDDELSDRLDITPNTVRTLLRNIYSQTGIRNRSNLILQILNSSK